MECHCHRHTTCIFPGENPGGEQPGISIHPFLPGRRYQSLERAKGHLEPKPCGPFLRKRASGKSRSASGPDITFHARMTVERSPANAGNPCGRGVNSDMQPGLRQDTLEPSGQERSHVRVAFPHRPSIRVTLTDAPQVREDIGIGGEVERQE